MTASTVTVAKSWPSWSTLPMTGESGTIWTVALYRLAPKDYPADRGLVEDEVAREEARVRVSLDC